MALYNNIIPIIYFHSVAPQKEPDWVRNFLTLELNYFESFLQYLKKHKWTTIFLAEYFDIRNNDSKANRKVCCLTFDDGFLDNYVYVFPLLKKYGFNATIFVNPDFVDQKREVALTLDDVWTGKTTDSQISKQGYLSWDEMRIMQDSGLVDIQSHTLTHTKNFISDEIVDFHKPGGDCLYPIGNLFPERKPYHILDLDFEGLIPFGTPFFRAASAITARKVLINNKFNEKISEILSMFDWTQKEAGIKALDLIKPEYLSWKTKNQIIESVENNEEMTLRLHDEISLSKSIIEEQLNKKVEFLCWPHGDNNSVVHSMAIEAGYRMTTQGKYSRGNSVDMTRIGERMGVNFSNTSKSLKTKFKLKAFSGVFPYSTLLNAYRK
jgi:hypothetical protein